MNFLTNLFNPIIALWAAAVTDIETEVAKLKADVTSATTNAETALTAEAHSLADQMGALVARMRALLPPAP